MEVSLARTCEILLVHTPELRDLLAARKAKRSKRERNFFIGYWVAAAKDMLNICSNGELEEMKKTPVSYTGRAPIEHPAGVDVSTADMRRFPTSDALHNIEIKHEADINGNIKSFTEAEIKRPTRNFTTQIGEGGFGKTGDMDPIYTQDGFLTRRSAVYSFGLVLRKLLVRKRVRNGDMDPIYTQEGCPMEIARDMASALVFLHSSLGRYSIVNRDLKPDSILLDEKVEPKISDFGLSRVHHADDHTHIPMGRAVHTYNGHVDAKFPSTTKHDIETSIGSHVSRLPRYLSVHHHPFMQILPSARNWITSKRTFGDIFEACISAQTMYKIPNINAGPVSEYIIRKLFGIWNGLTVNEAQQHSEPDSCRSDHGKMAGNTKTSASWIIATAAPHHATGNRSLLSGFVTEHDDQFVHAANRVPMKVLARGAVVTDTLILPDVWFVPGLKENLVSVSQLAELDHSIGFGRGECCIRSARDAKIVGKGRLQKGGQYVLDYLKVPLAI